VDDRAVTQGCACSLAQYGHLTASCTAGVACPQALQAEVNGGQFHDAALCNRQQPQPPLAAGGADAPAAGSRRSFASLLALAATRQQQAAPLLAVLLEAGADPTLASTATGAAMQPSMLPLAEAAAAGCLDAVAHLLRWAADQRCSLLRLGWPSAAAGAARRSLRSDSCHEALCLLLDAWEQQQRQQATAQVAPEVAPEACRSIVAALLEAHLQQQTTLGAAVLVSGDRPTTLLLLALPYVPRLCLGPLGK
jgi:hypothetical protein